MFIVRFLWGMIYQFFYGPVTGLDYERRSFTINVVRGHLLKKKKKKNQRDCQVGEEGDAMMIITNKEKMFLQS